MIRTVRRVVGLSLLAWSAWTLCRLAWRDIVPPRPGARGSTLEPIGLRVTPLNRTETAAALAAEQNAWREWIAAT